MAQVQPRGFDYPFGRLPCRRIEVAKRTNPSPLPTRVGTDLAWLLWEFRLVEVPVLGIEKRPPPGTCHRPAVSFPLGC